MNLQYLDFEQPIVELEEKISELRLVGNSQDVNLSEAIERLERECEAQTKAIFSDLSPWDITRIARHPNRPYTLDYIAEVFDDFQELHGDRTYADDPSIVGGLARIDGLSVMVIGQQKGRDVKEKVKRNFGMPLPEGYRKAKRLMEMAERFGLPVVTLIDTPGAFPGIGAEERGQSEAIARNIAVMSRLKTPIVSTVIGEGGSGGALAIGVCDRLNMFEYSTYSVISPEGCASILWKSAEHAAEAATAMGVTASRLKDLGLIDHIIDEPLGGAHRSKTEMALSLKQRIVADIKALRDIPVDDLIEQRYQRLTAYDRG
ncbi:acetyl-CoA carboxylase carboxyltransferase subunit alpha [Oleiphilus sp. HI0009]|uniref:acetyl-CoA carboxylase carboxyltransferase subunit alpha n=1 Tax=unclassified Oleiphilus TaxID=2631174 RepID=UPI0007C37FCB|nr:MULTISPECIES: acetyl-CoA carboxylase carboxyltransferase subunit alpha [unclassified Oleiphilus]KZX74005.1 acetyl-CoA carboxylase carboxyltransferase subunit alpha [Oleiphilus sp. HI0009]MCH2158752.1 acetyl-CoA carboxylase carboxyltransferase subunit alpha [Oleiphilaceae bacterium]KZX76623.1 acetyl-CoA carboxylase carboxyltransferase subunit alpha [Oleiphilus sp. HI0009]KZY61591.1 acetyl-CoA carboxylase carboxyltransferase subunit alpha [Oleiphilus sp. HI0066]KZY77251.1 acetyl-CoA carboxyla